MTLREIEDNIDELIVKSAEMALEAYGDVRYEDGTQLKATDKADIVRANSTSWVKRVKQANRQGKQ
jgi:hypothetical protein